MSVPKPTDELSTLDRLTAIAAILARGILRLRKQPERAANSRSAEVSESQPQALDVPPEMSVNGHTG